MTTHPESIAVGQNAADQPFTLVIGPTAEDGTNLLVIHEDGRVEGTVESASEAGAHFVQCLRDNFGWGLGITDAQVEAAQRALRYHGDDYRESPYSPWRCQCGVLSSAQHDRDSVRSALEAARGAA